MATETTKTEKVVKEKTMKIRLPITKELKDDVPVSVNSRIWLVKRGVDVDVPMCVYKQLRNQEFQLEQAMLYNESVKHD